MISVKLSLIFSLFIYINAETYFSDTFPGESLGWKPTKKTDKEYGKMVMSAGKYFGKDHKDEAIGLQTSNDARFYAYSTNFPKFSNEDKSLIIQYQVKHEQNIDCGGGYIKLMPSTVDPESFDGTSEYNIMFGPDICGATKKVHVIFSHYDDKEKKLINHLTNKDIKCEDDELSHVYTLIVKPDNTYIVKIDGKEVSSGSIEDDFGILPPKTINDPTSIKPDNWVDKKEMDDPTDMKPENWEKPEKIPDPKGIKPDTWDDEMDGEWEAPMIDNPEYKGEWKPKQIPNPDYKGPWTPKIIPNPEYKSNPLLYRYSDIGAIGLDLWQVKSGTIFDNFIITDDEKEAEDFMKKWEAIKDGEKKAKEELDKEKADKEASKKPETDDKDNMEEEDDETEDKDAEDKSEEPEEGPHDEL
ncbi:unnamed protein product [Gordionus sp. m RMFG-2023]|uniref:calreticulin-like n=1 Tax=Gordionus sp. m RMFG-2023 TaxID=3053472 RepID=UPI0030E5CE4B